MHVELQSDFLKDFDISNLHKEFMSILFTLRRFLYNLRQMNFKIDYVNILVIFFISLALKHQAISFNSSMIMSSDFDIFSNL